MFNIHNKIFKIIALTVATVFLVNTIAWAYPSDSPGSSTLSGQVISQPQMMTESAQLYRESILSDKDYFTEILSIGRYLLGDPEGKRPSYPLDHLSQVLGSVFKKAGLPMDKIDLDHVQFHPDNKKVILIPYTHNSKDAIIQFALRKDVSDDELAGYDWIVPDKYVIKVLPEGYFETPDAPREVKDEEAPPVKTETVDEVKIEPVEETEETKNIISGSFTLKRIMATVLMALLPSIALADNGQTGPSEEVVALWFTIVPAVSILTFIVAFIVMVLYGICRSDNPRETAMVFPKHCKYQLTSHAENLYASIKGVLGGIVFFLIKPFLADKDHVTRIKLAMRLGNTGSVVEELNALQHSGDNSQKTVNFLSELLKENSDIYVYEKDVILAQPENINIYKMFGEEDKIDGKIPPSDSADPKGNKCVINYRRVLREERRKAKIRIALINTIREIDAIELLPQLNDMLRNREDLRHLPVVVKAEKFGWTIRLYDWDGGCEHLIRSREIKIKNPGLQYLNEERGYLKRCIDSLEESLERLARGEERPEEEPKDTHERTPKVNYGINRIVTIVLLSLISSIALAGDESPAKISKHHSNVAFAMFLLAITCIFLTFWLPSLGLTPVCIFRLNYKLAAKSFKYHFLASLKNTAERSKRSLGSLILFFARPFFGREHNITHLKLALRFGGTNSVVSAINAVKNSADNSPDTIKLLSALLEKNRDIYIYEEGFVLAQPENISWLHILNEGYYGKRTPPSESTDPKGNKCVLNYRRILREETSKAKVRIALINAIREIGAIELLPQLKGVLEDRKRLRDFPITVSGEKFCWTVETEISQTPSSVRVKSKKIKNPGLQYLDEERGYLKRCIDSLEESLERLARGEERPEEEPKDTDKVTPEANFGINRIVTMILLTLIPSIAFAAETGSRQSTSSYDEESMFAFLVAVVALHVGYIAYRFFSAPSQWEIIVTVIKHFYYRIAYHTRNIYSSIRAVLGIFVLFFFAPDYRDNDHVARIELNLRFGSTRSIVSAINDVESSGGNDSETVKFLVELLQKNKDIYVYEEDSMLAQPENINHYRMLGIEKDIDEELPTAANADPHGNKCVFNYKRVLREERRKAKIRIALINAIDRMGVVELLPQLNDILMNRNDLSDLPVVVKAKKFGWTVNYHDMDGGGWAKVRSREIKIKNPGLKHLNEEIGSLRKCIDSLALKLEGLAVETEPEPIPAEEELKDIDKTLPKGNFGINRIVTTILIVLLPLSAFAGENAEAVLSSGEKFARYWFGPLLFAFGIFFTFAYTLMGTSFLDYFKIKPGLLAKFFKYRIVNSFKNTAEFTKKFFGSIILFFAKPFLSDTSHLKKALSFGSVYSVLDAIRAIKKSKDDRLEIKKLLAEILRNNSYMTIFGEGFVLAQPENLNLLETMGKEVTQEMPSAEKAAPHKPNTVLNYKRILREERRRAKIRIATINAIRDVGLVELLPQLRNLLSDRNTVKELPAVVKGEKFSWISVAGEGSAPARVRTSSKEIENPGLKYLDKEIGALRRGIDSLETGLKERSAAGAVSFHHVKAKGLNADLVKLALAKGTVPRKHMPDDKLKLFQDFLVDNGLDDDIIIVGGSIRDIFYGRKTSDIDFTIKMPLTEEESNDLASSSSQVTRKTYNRALRVLERLAIALDVTKEALLYSSTSDEKILFHGVEVSYVGPMKRLTLSGEPVLVRNLLSNSTTGEVFGGSGPLLLFMGMDAYGKLYGYEKPLLALLRGAVAISSDTEGLALSTVTRIMRLKYQYGLTLSKDVYATIKEVIDGYNNGSIPMETVYIKVADRQIDHIYKHADSKRQAMKELKKLGILKILDKARGEQKTDEDTPSSETDDLIHILKYPELHPRKDMYEIVGLAEEAEDPRTARYFMSWFEIKKEKIEPDKKLLAKCAVLMGRISSFNDMNAVDLLAPYLVDEDVSVRKATARAIKKLCSSKEFIVSAYMKALESKLEEKIYLGDIMETLGRFGEKKAINSLIMAISQPGRSDYKEAAEALEMLGLAKGPLLEDYWQTIVARNGIEGVYFTLVNCPEFYDPNVVWLNTMKKLFDQIHEEAMNYPEEDQEEFKNKLLESVNAYINYSAPKRRLEKITSESRDVHSLLVLVHDNLELCLRSIQNIGKSVSDFEELKRVLPLNNPLTRIIRLLGEDSEWGNADLVKSIIKSRNFDELYRIVVDTAEKRKRTAPQEISGILEILSLQKKPAKWSQRKWREFYEDIREYYNQGFKVITLKLFEYFREHKHDTATMGQFKSDISEQIGNIAWGDFHGLDDDFIARYSFSQADELALLAKYIPISNMNAKDYAGEYELIKKALQERSSWKDEVDEELRDLYSLSRMQTTLSYAGETTRERDELTRKLLGYVGSKNNLTRILGTVSEYMGKKTDLEKAVTALVGGEENAASDLQKAAVLAAIARSNEDSNVFAETPLTDEDIIHWLNSWHTLLADTWKKDSFEELREVVRTVVENTDPGVLKTSELLTKHQAVAENSIKERTDLFRPSQKVLKQTISLLSEESSSENKLIEGLSEIYKDNWFNTIAPSEVRNDKLITQWIDKGLEKYIKQLVKKIQKKSGELPISKDEFRRITREALLKARKKALEEGSNPYVLADRVAADLIGIFDDDIEAIQKELSLYKTIKRKIPGNLYVGFFDDLLHLMGFMMSGVCTWTHRHEQVLSTKTHFGKLAIKDSEGKILGLSQVQLLRAGIVGRSRAASPKGWKVLALPGINLFKGKTELDKERGVLALLEAAQRKAEELGMQGAVIPVNSTIHSNNAFEKNFIKELHQRGWLKRKMLSETVVLAEGMYDYREVYLIAIPADEMYLEDTSLKERVKAEKTQTRRIESEESVHAANGLIEIAFTKGTNGVVNVIKKETEELFASVPDAIKERVKRITQLNDITLRIRIDAEAENSDINKADNEIELTLAKDLLYEKGKIETVVFSEMFSELLAALLLEDYYQLKEASRTNENAYFKLGVIKGLLNYRKLLPVYHRIICKHNWKKKNFLAEKNAAKINKLMGGYKKSLDDATRGIKGMHQWNIFLNVMDNADPDFAIINYIHILMNEELITEDDIAALVLKVAGTDISPKASLARIRNVFKEFMLGGKVHLKTGSKASSVDIFDHFDDTPRLQALKDTIITSDEENEFYGSLKELISIILPLSGKRLDSEISKLVDQGIFEFSPQDREKAVKIMLKELLVRFVGNTAFESIKKHLTAQRGLDESIPYIDISSHDLIEGGDADDYGFLEYVQSEEEGSGIDYDLVFGNENVQDSGQNKHDWTQDLFPKYAELKALEEPAPEAEVKKAAEPQKKEEQAPEDTPETLEDSELPELFKAIRGEANNRRARAIEAANKINGYIGEYYGFSEDVIPIDKNDIPAKIKQRFKDVLKSFEKIDESKIPEELVPLAKNLREGLKRFEADAIAAALIALAMKAVQDAKNASRDPRKIIIAIETDWIRGELQSDAINSLISALNSINSTFRDHNIEVILKSSGESLETWSGKITEGLDDPSDLSNIIVFGSASTTKFFEDNLLKDVDKNNRAFLAGIDPTEIDKLYEEYGEAYDDQLKIELLQYLSITLEVVIGKYSPDLLKELPMEISYDKALRKLIILPIPDRMKYEDLKKEYKTDRVALLAA